MTMTKKFTWTVDTESDFGGRTSGMDGIDRGIPKILRAFKKYEIKALFFVNTEILEFRAGVIQDIVNEGHEIGLHGHFHAPFKEAWRQKQNMDIARGMLQKFVNQESFKIRSPKFSCSFYGQEYSYKTNHVGVLKHMWFGGKIPMRPIFYMHPFDIIGGKFAPNLFTAIWYRNPERAYETFLNLVGRYPGQNRLEENETKA